jgi:signal transduction histidine kinase
MLPRFFDFFEQGGGKVTRLFGGLGLGLAICKAIVELHRGSICAESAGPGLGSMFIVEIPGKALDTAGKGPPDGRA